MKKEDNKAPIILLCKDGKNEKDCLEKFFL